MKKELIEEFKNLTKSQKRDFIMLYGGELQDIPEKQFKRILIKIKNN